MPGLDPRVPLSRDRQDNRTRVLRTLGIASITAIGGVKLHSRFVTQRQVLEQAITNARERNERFAPIFRDIGDIDLENITEEDIKYFDDMRPGPLADWEDAYKADLEDIMELRSLDLTPDELNERLYKVTESVDTLNRMIAGEYSPDEMGRMFEGARVAEGLAKISKEYPEIQDLFSKIDGIEITKVVTSGPNYSIHISDGAKKEIVNLPKWKSGIINWRGGQYTFKSPARMISSDIIQINSFGFNVISRLEENMTSVLSKKLNKAVVVKDLFDNTISISVNNFVGNGNMIKGLLTQDFYLAELADLYGDAPSSGKSAALELVGQKLERSKIYMRISKEVGKRSMIPLEDVRSYTVPKGSIRSISDASSMKWSSISEVPFGLWPLTTWAKATQARMNYARGAMKFGSRSTIQELASKLGPTSRDVLSHLHTHMSMEIPGKMTNIGFYMGGKEPKGFGHGGVLWINRFMSNLDGTLSRQMNTEAYSAARLKTYRFPLISYLDIGEEVGKDLKAVRVRVNPETEKIISELIPGNATADGITLSKGTWLGGKNMKDSVKLEQDARVVHVGIDNGVLKISLEEKVPMHIGTKFDQSKLMVTRMLTSNQLQKYIGNIDGDHIFLGKMLSQSFGAEVAAEIIANQDAMSKFKGGALGWGFIQKLMSDMIQLKKQQIATQEKFTGNTIHKAKGMRRAVKEIRALLRTALGRGIDNIIEKVDISPDTLEPIVILKGRERMPDKITATTAHSAFGRVVDIEAALRKAQAGDWKEADLLISRLNKHFKNVGLNDYKIAVDLPKGAQDIAKYASSSYTYTPAIVRSISKVGDKINKEMIYLGVRSSMMTHQTSTNKYMTFAGSKRTNSGYIGGFKTTLDHMEIAAAAGWKHYVSYLHLLTDYNMDYIRDKFFASEMKALEEFPNAPPVSVTRMEKVRVISLPDNLASQLAEYRVEGDALRAAGRWRVIGNELSSLQGMIEDPDIAELIEKRVFDRADVRGTVHEAFGRFSVDVTEKELVQDIARLVSSADSKEAIYMKLPEAININGVEAKYIPIHNFDIGDTFELLAKKDVDGKERIQSLTRKFYTGSGFYSNQMQLIKNIGDIQTSLTSARGNERKVKELKTQLKSAVDTYYKNLGKLMKGKFSNIKSAMFEHRMPFSTRGIINAVTVENTAEKILRGVSGVPTDSVYLHEDDIAKLITGGKVSSMGKAKKIVNTAEAIRTVMDRLGKYTPDVLDKTSSEDLYKLSQELGRALSKISTDELSDEGQRAVKAAVSTGRMLSRGKGKLVDKVKRVGGDLTLKSLINDIRAAGPNISETILGIDSIKDIDNAVAVYRYAHDTVNLLKEGKIDVYGMLVGQPQISQLSLAHFKLKAIQSDEFTQAIFNKKTKKYIMDHADYFKGMEGRIYAGVEMIESISRDLDLDPIAFVVNSLDVLEEQSRKAGGLSILTETGLFNHLSGNEAKMQLFHDLTEESLTEVVLRRLALYEDVTGEKAPPFRPASITSMTVMEELSSAMTEGRVAQEEVRSYVKKSVERLYSESKSRQISQSAGGKEAMTNRIVDKIIEKARKFRGANVTEDELRVLTSVRDAVTSKKDPKKFRTLKDKAKIAKEYPEQFEKAATGLQLTDDEVRIRDALGRKRDEAIKIYANELLEESERFHNIKVQTPEAYNAAKALFGLSYGYVTNEQDKAFLVNLADKVIEQNTISSKHGTPVVLPDLVKTLRKLSDVRSIEVSDDILTKAARGDIVLRLFDYEKKEMKRIMGPAIGNKLEDVTMDVYEDYLEKRVGYLSELEKLQYDTITEMSRSDALKKAGTAEINKEYRTLLDAKMKSSETMKSIEFPRMFYDNVITSEELERAKDARSNVKKFRNVITFGVNKDDTAGMEKLKERWTSIIRASKEATDANSGVNIFDSQTTKLFRSFEGKELNAFEAAYNLRYNKEAFIQDDAGRITVKVRNKIESALARVMSIVSSTDANNTLLSGPVKSEREARLRILADREVNRIRSAYTERLAQESTVFRSGSLFNVIEKKVNTATGSAIEDGMLKSVGRMKAGSLLVGLMTGTIIGQSLNQIVSGYPVPDLKGTAGLGGEYYEKRRGILGSEMEIMLQKRPMKITPNDKYDRRAMKDLAYSNDAGIAYGSRVDLRRLESSFRGSVIR